MGLVERNDEVFSAESHEEMFHFLYERESLYFRLKNIRRRIEEIIRTISLQLDYLEDEKFDLYIDLDMGNLDVVKQILVVNERITKLVLEKDCYQQRLENVLPHIISTNNGTPNREVFRQAFG